MWVLPAPLSRSANLSSTPASSPRTAPSIQGKRSTAACRWRAPTLPTLTLRAPTRQGDTGFAPTGGFTCSRLWQVPVPIHEVGSFCVFCVFLWRNAFGPYCDRGNSAGQRKVIWLCGSGLGSAWFGGDRVRQGFVRSLCRGCGQGIRKLPGIRRQKTVKARGGFRFF